ncbi:MAG: hypothetical protein IGS03_03365 [Candidatus Sericytochromatia bacterium]|nr:hypothetical protein [Candidatus Sericytochromatia bacterium]
MPPSSDFSDRLSSRQLRIWGVVVLTLMGLGLLISWGLPALLETRLPPNLRRSAQPSASPDSASEAETEFVIVEYGNPAAGEVPEEIPENTTQASASPDMSAETPPEALEDSRNETNSTDTASDTPVRDTLQPSRLASRTANTDPPPMQSLASQRQLVEPPSLPPRSGTITQNTQPLTPPVVPPKTASPASKPASEKPAPAGSLRIWVGPFAGQEQARTASEKLSTAGHANQVITEGGSIRLRLNQTAANPDEALDLAEAVALLGFEITVRKAD